MVDTTSPKHPTVLLVAPIMPSDRGNGLAMRTGFFLDAYAQRFAVDLAVVPVAGGDTAVTPFVAERARRVVVLPLTAPDTYFTLIKAMADPLAQLAAFRRYARPSITTRLNADVERALIAFAAERYHLVHISRTYLAALARPWMSAAEAVRPGLILDCDEDDATAYRFLARLYRDWGHRQRANWAEAEADAFKVFAAQWLPRFDLRFAASTGEAHALSARAGTSRVYVVPNVTPSAAASQLPHRAGDGRHDIVFVGTLSYLPNVDAALWFAKRVWPRLRVAVPFPVRFVIAGHAPPPSILALARRPSIVVRSGVKDTAMLYRSASLAVVPIRAGGGTRIKLLESAKYGVPVVATRFGAAGTSFLPGQEILLADNAHDFATCCARVLTDGKLASRLRTQAMKRACHDYDAGRVALQLFSKLDAFATRS